MTQHKTIQPKRTPRGGRRRFGPPERSLAAASWLSVLVVLGVALAVYAVKFAIPTSALHNFLELTIVNGQVSAESPLYQDLLYQIRREDALYTVPGSLFCGGLALALLAPHRSSRTRVIRAAVIVPVGIMAVCLCLFWGAFLVKLQGHLPPGIVNTSLVLTQSLVALADVAASALGAFFGMLLRHRRARSDGSPSPEAGAGAR